MRAPAAAFALAILWAGGAPAAGPWTEHEGVSFRLVAAAAGVPSAGEVPAGIHVRLRPSWKFFWRAPGPYGIAPTVSTEGSANVAEARLLWPAPSRLPFAGLPGADVIGYRGEFVLPLMLTPAKPEEPMRLRLALDYGICREICLPDRTELALDLPGGGGGPTKEARLIRRYRARVPVVADSGAVTVRRDGGALVVEATGATPFRRPDVFVDAGPDRHFAAPDVKLSQDRRRASFRLAALPGASAAAALPERLSVVVVDGARAIEARLPAAP